MYKKCRLCVLWFLVFVFLSFENFPDLREDRLEPSGRRDFGGCRSYDEEADGAPKSRSQLILLLRFLFAWGGGRGWAKFPMPGTPFPPFFTWRTPTRPSRPSSSGNLLHEAYSDFTGCLSLLPMCFHVLCFPFCLSDQHAFRGCHLSLSPPADCKLLEGKGPMSCVCLCLAHPPVSVEIVGGWD